MFSLCSVSSNLTWYMLVWFLLYLLCLECVDLHRAVGFYPIWISFNYCIFKYFSTIISLLFLGLHLYICSTTQILPWLTAFCAFFLPSPFSVVHWSFLLQFPISHWTYPVNFSFQIINFFCSRSSIRFLFKFPLLLRLPRPMMLIISFKSLPEIILNIYPLILHLCLFLLFLSSRNELHVPASSYV